MQNIKDYRKIYRYIIDALDGGLLKRSDLIAAVMDRFSLSDEERADDGMNSRINAISAMSGTVINDMEKKKIIAKDKNGFYYRALERAVAIRIEECEHEILNLLKTSARTKREIREELINYFGTDTTSTVMDDNKLFTYIGQILKRLVSDETLIFNGSLYSMAKEKSAYIENKSEMLLLRGAFLQKIHSKGGEFFEHYFLQLITKYLLLSGKKVTESHVTGGSFDGGIDGIVKTVDSLGFRETIMIQTKNRTDISTETDVRGFYGAVCAQQGSRGIYAITSEFHPMAIKFLNSIDNCVGIDGEKIFDMALKVEYGIKKDGNKMIIDSEII